YLADKLAYFFVTDDVDAKGLYVSGGWPGDGESAVIIQPGVEPACSVETIATGPTIHAYDQRGPSSGGRLTRIIEEFAVKLEWGDDPEFVSEAVIWGWDNLELPQPRGWPQ